AGEAEQHGRMKQGRRRVLGLGHPGGRAQEVGIVRSDRPQALVERAAGANTDSDVRIGRNLPPPPMATLVFWIAATGLVMATINTIGVAADAYRWGLGAAQWPFHALHAGALVPIQ